MNHLGDKLRTIREGKGILLRQVAAKLDADTAFISKLERGEKRASKEQVIKLAKFFDVAPDELITLWLCDKIIDMVKDIPQAEAAMKMALKDLKAK